MDILIWTFLISIVALFLFLRWLSVRLRKPKPHTTTSTSNVTAQFGSNDQK